MPDFSLDNSLARAAARLGVGELEKRRLRSDRGRSRLDPAILTEVERLLGGWARPMPREILAHLTVFCGERGLRAPSRATIYSLLRTMPVPSYRTSELPQEVRDTLYNLAGSETVPGHQLAFHCFNYGTTRALCFAAGLPWLTLHRAARMRGWRPKSRGLVEAVLRARSA